MRSENFSVFKDFSESTSEVIDQTKDHFTKFDFRSNLDAAQDVGYAAYKGLGLVASKSPAASRTASETRVSETSHTHHDNGDGASPHALTTDPRSGSASAASLPTASLTTLAQYLTIETSTASQGSLRFNIDDNGTGANSGRLYYNMSGYGSDTNGISAARQALVRQAFAIYEQVLGIDFVETTSTADSVDFFFIDNGSGANAATFKYSGTNLMDYARINIAADWNGGSSSVGDYTFQAILHEIGHGLGLGHAGDYSGAGQTFSNDSWALSMMSYYKQGAAGTVSDYYSPAMLISPMAADWIALNTLYASQDFTGKDFGINNAFTGDTVWGFTTNITAAQGGAFTNLAALADTNAFTIIDSGGNDTVDFSGFSAIQTIDLRPTNAGAATASVSSVGGLVSNMALAAGTIIENATGGSGADFIIGNQFANRLIGNAGNDSILGGAGTDALYGNDGNDTLKGEDGNDSLYGSTGNDVSYGGEGNDVFFDGDGDDKLYGENGNDTIAGGAGTDRLYGGNNDDTLYGEAGNDVIRGEAGNDVLNGGVGDDSIVSGAGNDTVTFGDGVDRYYFENGSGYDIITDFGADDVIDFRLSNITRSMLSNSFSTHGTSLFVTFGSDAIVLQNTSYAELNLSTDFYFG